MLDIENLLVDHPGDTPCGDDIEAFTEKDGTNPYLEINNALRERAGAPDPDWKLVKKYALTLSKKAHHLYVAISLTRALLNLNGYAGLAAGSAYIAGMIERYWDCLFPPLDPDDQDPISRLNLFLEFEDDGYRFHNNLVETTLISLQGFGALSIKDQRELAKLKDDDLDQKTKRIEAILRESTQEDKKQAYATLEECQRNFQTITDLLQRDDYVGASKAPAFGRLISTLEEGKALLADYIEGDEPAVSEEEIMNSPQTSNVPVSTASSTPAAMTRAEGIHSRADVINALEAIEGYYHKHEPGSPVPLMIRRARQMVDKDFMALLEELAPESLSNIELIFGKSEASSE